MADFNNEQSSFLRNAYVARIATCGNSRIPHVSPIYFANDSSSIFFATESSTVKYRDLRENPLASTVVDDFEANWLKEPEDKGADWKTKERAVIIRGKVSIFQDGNDQSYVGMYRSLFEKYPDYRAQGWQRGEYPIIQVSAEKITSWGL